MQRKGICKNVGLCNNANTHKIIVINDDNEPFECPECHEPLEPVNDLEPDNNGNPKNKGLWIILTAIAVAVIAGLIIWMCTADGSSNGEPEGVVTDSIVEEVEIESIPLNIDSIAQAKADSIMAAKAITDSLQAKVMADSIKLAQADSIIAANHSSKNASSHVGSNGRSAQQSAAQKASASNGKIRLSYGSYTGDIKDGYPDGMGRLVYSTSRQVNRYDSKKRTAAAGDYVIGEFMRGFFVQGKHYDSNGNLIETLMIGAPANNQYENK